MADTRKRLTDLILNVPELNHAEAYVYGREYAARHMADWLLENGVTISDPPPKPEPQPTKRLCIFWSPGHGYQRCECGLEWRSCICNGDPDKCTTQYNNRKEARGRNDGKK